MEWPPYSPDLNPSKVVWAWLKVWIDKNHPELATMGSDENAYRALFSYEIIVGSDSAGQD
jgi:transposase